METKIYPLGKAPYGVVYEHYETLEHLKRIKTFPTRLRYLVNNLKEDDLHKTYRHGGWVVAQIIHHIADSHINAYVRTKLLLTESTPTIKPYDENLWADTDDSLPSCDIHFSLSLLEALHARWIVLFQSVKESDWEKEFFHPENKQYISLRNLAGLYAWHGDHHLEHIRLALDK